MKNNESFKSSRVYYVKQMMSANTGVLVKHACNRKDPRQRNIEPR